MLEKVALLAQIWRYEAIDLEEHSEINSKWKSRITKLLTNRTDHTLIQLFRYTFVGGIACLVDIISLYTLTEYAHIHYLFSAALAFLLGLTVNYVISVIWVFNRRKLENRGAEFAIFGVIGVVGLGFNEVFIWFFTERVGLYYMLAKIVSTVVVYFWHFFARKFILFH